MAVPLSVSVPSDGKLATIYVMVSPSASVPANVMVFASSSVASTVWAVAVGASFTAVMLIVTVAASLSELPSLTLNVKLSLVAVSDVLV